MKHILFHDIAPATGNSESASANVAATVGQNLNTKLVLLIYNSITGSGDTL
jgi:hypothetical protein